MNIAFVVVKHIALGGGIERYTEELGARLVQRGHAVRVYSMRRYGAVTPWHRGMKIITVPSIPGAGCEKLSASIAAMIHAGLSPWADIIHLHTVAPGAMGWFMRLCRKPALVQFHGVEWQRSRWSSGGSKVLKILERRTILNNRRFTAVSHAVCDYFQATYGVGVRYIPGGADLKKILPAHEILALGLTPGRYVLSASRLVREKGAHHLIEAFRRVDTSFKLVLAGDVHGEDAYKQELQRLAGTDARILFTGFVTGPLLEELYGHACLYVQPSDVEGLSLALLEAMGYGTCCLVSDIPENREAIGSCGFSFRRGDAVDLAARLQHLLDHPDVADICRVQARARVKDEYAWDRVADDFATYYQEILRGTACHE